MFDRRTLLALVVVGLIFLLLPKYWEWVSPKQPPAPGAPPGTAVPDTTRPDTARVRPDTAGTALREAPVDTAAAAVVAADTLPLAEQFVTVETPLFSMALASDGRISRYTLKQYHLAAGDPVGLSARTPGRLVGTVDIDFGGYNIHSLEKARFTANKNAITLEGGRDSVVLRQVAADGRQVTLTYAFDAEQYGFELALATQGLAVPENGEYQIRWLGGVPITEPDPTRDLQYSGAYARVGDELENLSVASDARKDFTATGATYFVAARSKYFIAALIPQEAAAGAELVGVNPAPKVKTSPQYYDLTLRQSWGQNAAGRWRVYWGPIKYKNLERLGVGLDGTMNWGWAIIRPFSKATLWSLEALGRVIPNYGLVIIVFSILVKIILWPLTRKSQVSMKKMASLQPELQQLRETHAKNPQALNAAIMRLYKERGVNPASGCVPILLQMPVLYALFVIFSSTIEFRQAPFIAWISDLSMPDWVATLPFSLPLYGSHVAILPIIMGITQFIMSKRTVTDPNQKAMLYIMPVFMLLIFNNLPSGLTLYYTLFNVLAIVEQNLIKVPDFSPSVQVMDEPKKKRGLKK